eukprot:5261788-Alexandrium_andersonii.AAC.1
MKRPAPGAGKRAAAAASRRPAASSNWRGRSSREGIMLPPCRRDGRLPSPRRAPCGAACPTSPSRCAPP